VDAAARYRLDDLRRFGAALGAAAGLAPARAAALATHLLWFDAAGRADFGLATLPAYLDRIDGRAIDPAAEGRVVAERAATAEIDGGNGVPPLVLSRAAAIAGEKARDAGVGLVRVAGLGAIASAAAVAAEMAVGPEVGALLGPGPSWTLALPSAEGLPAVFDSDLAGGQGMLPGVVEALGPWRVLAPEGGWLVVAVAVGGAGALSAFRDRVAALLGGREEAPGLLLPGPWDDRRRRARERGIPLATGPFDALRRRAEPLGIPAPAPCT
jgi:LDH2 family malate/lactate/ureidoglycolate dehydrogenase